MYVCQSYYYESVKLFKIEPMLTLNLYYLVIDSVSETVDKEHDEIYKKKSK